MPIELVSGNADVLKARVLELAQGDGFRAYLETDVIRFNSLVDQIVSRPIEPAGAVAEPYVLWAIEDQPRLRLPCVHRAVERVKTLSEIGALKLFVLNPGHTVLADRWISADMAQSLLVRDLMTKPEERAHLKSVYTAEVRACFAAADLADAFDSYAAITFERFENPFLDHAIKDIAQNHKAKVERRIAAFLQFARASGDLTEKPVLENICSRSKEKTQ